MLKQKNSGHFCCSIALTFVVLMLGLCCSQAQIPVITNVVSFDRTNGYRPGAALLQVADGTLYGCASGGGTSGLGTVYRISTNGDLTVLVNFNLVNGGGPNSPLIAGPDGTLYGTTVFGGSHTADDHLLYSGYGTIFSISTIGDLATLASFDNAHGAYPNGVSMAADGTLYGTAAQGGTFSVKYGLNSGSFWKYDSTNGLAPLVLFNGTNGANPNAVVIPCADGSVIGTTSTGGSTTFGEIFSYDTNGNLNFPVAFNGTNGAAPINIIPDGNNGFYGLTSFGGTYSAGTIFQIAADGTFSNLFSFNGTNGSSPVQLLKGQDGNLYGITSRGGTLGMGLVFEFSTNGVYSKLYEFSGGVDGRFGSSLMQAADGSFYGTTLSGGASATNGYNGFGNIFNLKLAPVPNIQSISITDGMINLSWPAATGVSYDVQYKSGFADTNWQHLANVTACCSTATFSEPKDNEAIRRLYRVRVIQ